MHAHPSGNEPLYLNDTTLPAIEYRRVRRFRTSVFRPCVRSAPTPTEVIDMVRIEAGYFEANAERMRYPEFRRQGLFVGTGVMEAGCKTVIGSRLKQSGMFWTVRGANAIIALRCCQLSGNFEDYWEARHA